jgi:4-oxalocrotonate tautomerase
MPVVIVEMWEGRSAEQKKELVKGICAAFEKIGTPAQAVHIILKDNPKSNWAQGNKLASES